MGGILSGPKLPPPPPPPPPPPDPDEEDRKRRVERLDRQRRGRAGLVTTSRRGLLANADNDANVTVASSALGGAQGKTKLGE